MPCLERPPVALYLERVQQRIFSVWALPPDAPTGREVVIELRIDADGFLRRYDLVSYDDQRLALSVQHAVLRASPFDRVPADAACVAGRSIRTTFANPS